MDSHEMPEMSEEQYTIYNSINDGDNVVVDACAGSGKSTTILSISKKMDHKRIVQLTYNSMLCTDIKKKIESYKLDNLSVFTYHSLVVKYYNPKGYTDTVIRGVVFRNIPPKIPIPHFDILVLDETQDMTLLYFKLIVKFCKDMGSPVQMLILGDFMQGLYEFKGADTRFLTRAKDIWVKFPLLRSPNFREYSLKMSYRITQPMADFVNNNMLGDKRLHACRDGPRVVYFRHPIHNVQKYIIHKIKTLIHENRAVPSDFFILAASMKGNNKDIRKIENALVQHNIPCHVPMKEDDKVDERVTDNKVVFSTFHSVKGRQRKYVFVIGFNQSYFDYYARTLPKDICPNTLYVACTRATHELFVVELNNNSLDRPPLFLKSRKEHPEDYTHVEMNQQPYVDFKGLPQIIFQNKKENTEKNQQIVKYKTTPTDLIRFLPEDVLDEINPILEKIFIPIQEKIEDTEENVTDVIQTKNGFYEDVGDINATVIPILYFDRREKDVSPPPNKTKLIELIHENMRNNNINNQHNPYLEEIVNGLESMHTNTINEYLNIANVHYAVKNRLYSKIKQIDQYDWLSEENISFYSKKMDKVLGDELDNSIDKHMEYTIIESGDDESHRGIDAILREHFPGVLFRFTARLDLKTDQSIWELKFTSTISSEHFLHVVIYAWLWRILYEDIENLENIRLFQIFNIKTGEHYILDATTEELSQIVISILYGKYSETEHKSDEEFLEDCKNEITRSFSLKSPDGVDIPIRQNPES